MVIDPLPEAQTEQQEAVCTEREVDVIALAGIEGSPEAQACEEWKAFEDAYDSDGAILKEIGDKPTGIDSRYSAYICECARRHLGKDV